MRAKVKSKADKRKVKGTLRQRRAQEARGEEDIRPAKAEKADDQAEALESEAKSAFYSLPRAIRDLIRKKYKTKDWSYASWLLEETDKWARRARRARQAAKSKEQWKDFGAFLKASKQTPIKIKDVAPHQDKRIAKDIRKAMMPKPPKNPFAALMQPMVIVPDDPDAKVVVADAGSIIKLADQRALYRDRTSPITHRADEILVHFGKGEKPTLGWISHRHSSKSMKPSKGPTFLVNTKSEDGLDAWDQLRLKVGRARKSDTNIWIARWLATHGAKYPRQLREVTRLFGGKPIKNEAAGARIERLFSLILNTELDMATAKKGKKNKKSKKGKAREEKSSSKKSSKKTKTKSDRISKKNDDDVIKRLVKENPRRAGTAKAKIWDKLKKGMTVGEFVAKGGSRASVGRYIQNGWVKLLRAKSSDDE